MVVAVDGFPQARVVMLRELLDPAVAAVERHWAGAVRRRRIDRHADRLAGDGSGSDTSVIASSCPR